MEEALRVAYERSDMSLEQFAEGLGVTPNRAIVILNSDGNIKMSTAAKALAVLGCTIELVVTDRDGNPVPSTTNRRNPR
ncbi:helix-turn-helix domain-containing protein [Aeromicrobium sp. 179-A 4D2 NHS]